MHANATTVTSLCMPLFTPAARVAGYWPPTRLLGRRSPAQAASRQDVCLRTRRRARVCVHTGPALSTPPFPHTNLTKGTHASSCRRTPYTCISTHRNTQAHTGGRPRSGALRVRIAHPDAHSHAPGFTSASAAAALRAAPLRSLMPGLRPPRSAVMPSVSSTDLLYILVSTLTTRLERS
eukprot:364314-Chlamydomonas_euryale.AAC.7